MTTPDRLRELAAAVDPRAGITGLFFLFPGEGVTNLLLVRHAQTQSSDRTGGDVPLTDLGREQAEVLARHLSYGKLDAIYVSPTLRARETAAPLARVHTLSPQTVEDLRDIELVRPIDKPIPELLVDEYGPAEGPMVLERMRKEMSFDPMAPFLESSASFRGRVTSAIEGIIEQHEGESVAVVTHAPVIMVYVASVLASSRLPFSPKLTSITRVLALDGRRTLDYANATPHFDVR